MGCRVLPGEAAAFAGSRQGDLRAQASQGLGISTDLGQKSNFLPAPLGKETSEGKRAENHVWIYRHTYKSCSHLK